LFFFFVSGLYIFFIFTCFPNKIKMAGQPKKFGAFAGVFTPSILTILGVIMYLRLGWVAGVAGIGGSIAIILLAHVISVTTGLSISSIATDKKIKAGGIYYILSRSLGLPMGGSIGITLYVGTALSISLYIVGFVENFLDIPTMQHWLGMAGPTVENTRIIGTVVLVLLAVIALISTNFAIKTQFIVLAAIGLSLVSIFVGFFLHPAVAASTSSVPFTPFKDYSFTEVFAIFFPAVTGFTAGVAMSGDLKNPKKDIPLGTLLAIFTGLIIYLLLAVSFNLFVDRQLLLTNYNFLMTIAWIPVLVVAGVWGATLSSALGGILGGPRIIQAISKDKITPQVLAQGQGKNNEPRNALLFTFLLSELGILVGDLNVIAGLVTMFYLTAYGFINLAFVLEKWASPDFRPGFRIPAWVGVLGFVTSFIIMFKLDMIAMLGALLILGFIFFLIRKKQLHLAMDDIWPSVLASLIRAVLARFKSMRLTEANWRANILLFSGGKTSRPHLVEFSRFIAGKQGLISNFDLVLKPNAHRLFPSHHQAIPEEEMEGDEAIFKRRQVCNDIYGAMEILSATYGFSGVEPNTVVLGWGRHTKDPIRFTRMLRYFEDMDLNIVLLDYDKNRGFGNYQKIDVWLRGGSNNGNLMLSLMKFIHNDYAWHKAVFRVLLITDNNRKKSAMKKRTRYLLNSHRMPAEVEVLVKGKEDNVHDMIKQQSAGADLILMGLAEVKRGREKDFMERADSLYNDLGTVALVKASSFFSELHIGDYL
jgi:amino acid transporter